MDALHAKHKRLREGYTTGSAAAAAAAAAMAVFLTGETSDAVGVLPPYEDGASLERLTVPLLCCRKQPIDGVAAGYAEVVKDGGDDPDATNGMLITAYASDRPLPSASPVLVIDEAVTLCAGEGIGVATLPGLPVRVGEIAVNPAPRRQIAAALKETARRCGYSGPIYCRLGAPDGEKRARRTLNPRLGILGGISILGTRGTVKPFSTEAWQATISQGLDVAAALACDTVCLTTGRRSEKALQTLLPDLPPHAFIQAADHAGFSIREAASRNFTRIAWACFPGKLLKLAQGLAWTHAKASAPDFLLLAALCEEAGFAKDVVEDAITIPTVTGALDKIFCSQPQNAAPLMSLMAQKAATSLRRMANATNPPPAIRVYVFDAQSRLLATGEG